MCVPRVPVVNGNAFPGTRASDRYAHAFAILFYVVIVMIYTGYKTCRSASFSLRKICATS